MIARVYRDCGHLGYVALYLDPDARGRRVWVPIVADTAKDDDSLLMAFLLCVLTLQASIGSLLTDVRKLCALMSNRADTDRSHREMQTAVEYIADSLEREGENLLRLIEQPTADDEVELDTAYVVVEPMDGYTEPGDLLRLASRGYERVILRTLFGRPPGRASPDDDKPCPGEASVMDDEFLITRHQFRAGRILSGLSIRDLAERAGLSPTAINQIATGKTQRPHKKTLQSLATVLRGMGVEFFRGGWVRHRSDLAHERRAVSAVHESRQTRSRS